MDEGGSWTLAWEGAAASVSAGAGADASAGAGAGAGKGAGAAREGEALQRAEPRCGTETDGAKASKGPQSPPAVAAEPPYDAASLRCTAA